jgi:type I restriction enzyme M protein
MRSQKVLTEKIVSILSHEFGYPIFSAIKFEVIERDNFTRLDFYSNSKLAFLTGVIKEKESLENLVPYLKLSFDEHQYCTLGFAYNGLDLAAFKHRSRDSDIIRLKEFEPYRTQRNSIKEIQYLNSPGKTSAKLCPVPEKFESVFFEAHSHIRDIDGLHADEALDELCKLIYTKLFDEEHTNKNTYYKFQKSIYGNESELATSISALYYEANEYDKRVYSLKIPGYKRSRGVFDHPIKLSSPSLSRVVEEFQKFDFTSTPLDIKGRAFQNVFLPALRSGMGQYFTPAEVIKLIITSISPTYKDLVLDPFCGSGHFLTESLDHVRRLEDRDKIVDDFAYHKLHGIEKSERMVRIAMTDMRLHGDGHANIRCTDALLPFENYYDIEPGSFDLVLTNPPFGSILGKESIATLGSFELANTKNKVPLEILGLERSIQFLKESGKLAIVLPESILVNNSTKYVRDWLSSKVTISAIVSLPIETFSPFGANIKTSILFLKKEKPVKTKHAMFVVVENVGYDASGRRNDSNDVMGVSMKLREFLGNEGW